MGLLNPGIGPGLLGGQRPVLPRVPYAQNPAITMAGIGLLSGRNLNEGFANLAQTVPAGLAAKSGMQQFMVAQQEREQQKAEAAAHAAQMNDVIKNFPNIPEHLRPYYMANPDQFGSYVASTMTPDKPMVVGNDSQIYDPATKTFTAPPGGGEPDPASIANITTIRKDLEDEQGTSRYRTAAPILQSMVNSVNDPSSMADLDFVYGMAKIFDPGSVVRESEMGLVIDSQSMPATIKGRLEKILNGEAVLQPQARRDLVRAASTRVQEYRAQAETEGQFFTGIATRNRIDPMDVVRPLEPMPALPPPPAPGTVEGGYRFKGGDPADPASWEPVGQ